MKLIKLLTSIIFIFLAGAILGASAGLNPIIMGGVFASIGLAGGTMVALGYVKSPKGLAFFNFVNLEWLDGEKNMGGLKTIGYFAPIADIDNFPELPANPATPEDEVTLESVTGFTFLAGKFFRSLYSTQETSEIKDEPQGELDGQSFKQSAEIFYPGTKAAALAFAANVNNSNMVFVFEEASGGNRRVIGSRAFPAKCKPSFTTGKATADRKGMTLTITSYGYTPAPLYNGPITLEV